MQSTITLISLHTETPSLEQAEVDIGIHVNTNKTEFTCFEQGTISNLSGQLLKLVNQFTYLGRNILSTERDVNIHLEKAWTAIESLSII